MIENSVDLENNDNVSISLPPGTVVGYRVNGQPIYNIAGGSVEVDSNVDDDDDDTVDDSDDDAEDEYVPPTKEEFERLLQAKQKADSEAAARKRFLREAGLDPKTGKAVSKPKPPVLEDLDDEDEEDPIEAAIQQRKDAKGDTKARSDKQFQRQLEREIAKTESRVRAEARDETTALLTTVPEALKDAGWNGNSLKRIVALLDLDELHVDSDGEVDGLKEQIDALKEDFPHFFKRTRMKEAAKEVADTKTVGGGRKTAPAADTNLSWTERLKADLYKH